MNASGILLVDKPEGLSSAAVVAKIKKHFDVDKVGHGGTLDPFATGLLVLLLGEATKISRFLLEGDKCYEAIAHIGFATTTGDKTGEKNRESGKPWSKEDFRKLIPRFTGEIRQIPPNFSAVKKHGKALYEYARKGIEIQAEPRTVEIKDLEILSCASEELVFKVSCSGGTYIRVLAEDWAKAAGQEAHLTALRRTQSSQFSLKDATPLARILEQDKIPLLPIEAALSHLPQVLCDDREAELVRHGNLEYQRSVLPRCPQEGFHLLLQNGATRSHPLAVVSRSRDGLVIERVFDRTLLQT